MKNARKWIHLLSYGLVAAAMTCLAGCNSQSQHESNEQAKQRFIEAIEAASGTAELKRIREFDELLEGESWFIDLTGAEISKSLMAAILEQTEKPPGTIASLNLSKSTITSEQMLELDTAMLCNFTLYMDLSDTGVDDTFLDNANNLYCLKTLNLKGSKVTAAAVKRFRGKRRASPEIERQFKDPEILL